MKPRAAIYCRVSTEEQSTENQLQAITAWAKARGYEVVKVYSEQESAWRQGHQRALGRLLDDLESGRRKYDACLTWSLDRITREGIGTLTQIYNRFNRCGCKLISLHESFTEYPNEFTPIFLAMIGFFAKWESDRRSERTKAGMLRKARECGGRIPPRGPDKKKRKRRRARQPLWDGG